MNNCKKQPGESIHSFHQRFKLTVEACQVKKVMPFTSMAQLIYVYLHVLQEPALKPILLDIETKNPTANEWINLETLDDVRDKAIPYL